MLLSQKEALKLWCPFARVQVAVPGSIAGAVSVNRDGNNGTPCQGEHCMSWRWAGWATEFGTYAQAPAEGDKHGPRLGYCGLAGKPFGVT